MSWLSDLFGGKSKIRQALKEGGIIIDLRPAPEYDQGHIPRSLNIPVDRIRANIGRIRDMRRPIILCCAHGSHCWEAMSILKEAGIDRVYYGGGWESVWRVVRGA
ncbi:MAG: rhodanese-like domain-containing protein [Bacteroidota bacterium]|nr:rhodanese-like domain-containing protein [Bacteroidota bacterium]MDP4244985.1 rhodanese-like domain-containing protein [Bacteroidota bacterium]MDP4255459.1 rhodanese-like domain-containing protein [Bacteroidota bacterium]MDP4256708.1 rhodanese-like domain-containing protein [Bacteroidota bacterium]